MKILLINPPVDIVNPPTVISFGMAYIAQELLRGGHEVKFLDIYGEELEKDEVSAFIQKETFDVVAVGGLVTIYPYLHWLIPFLKEVSPETPIILGGGIASSLKLRCFEKFDIDFSVIGEGEVTVIELLKEIEGERDFNQVKGIGFRQEGDVVFTESRPLMPTLDNVPWINEDMFPIKKILENSKGVFQIHTQRGCPFNCTFCFNNYRVVSSKVRYRKVKDIVDEIEHFDARYDIRLFALAGELIMMDRMWMIDFCKELLHRKLNISYRVTSRASTMDEEVLEWLQKSGCISMSIGLESGSNKILKIMKKGANVALNRNAVQLARRYIPNLELSMMLGYIGETKETIQESIDFFKEIDIKPVMFVAIPFPGTELYEFAVRDGRIPHEEDFLMALDKTSILNVSSLSFNLTDMSQDVAIAKITAAFKQIDRYYVYRNLVNMRYIRGFIRNLRENGLMPTLRKVAAALKVL